MTKAADQRAQHHGDGAEFFVIFLVNFLLTVLTLGIYSFWAKARKRRYLWSQTSFDGERFEYTGTGLEAFLGFLKALGFLLLAAIVLGAFAWALSLISSGLALIPLVLGYLFVLFVGPLLGLYGARRYKLARTRFRSVRFSLDGSQWKFACVVFGNSLLSLLSLFIYAPFAGVAIHSYVTNNMKFGSEAFRFTGKGAAMFGPYIIALLLTLPTLGLVWIWYGMKRANYYASQTAVGDISFKLDYRLGSYLLLVFTNLLLLVFSLGLALPWIMVRNTRFYVDHLTVDGEMNYDAVRQSATRADATGEGLAQVFEVESFA